MGERKNAFFKMYLNMPELWNKSNENYGNPLIRRERYQKLLFELRKYVDDATIDTVREIIANFWHDYGLYRVFGETTGSVDGSTGEATGSDDGSTKLIDEKINSFLNEYVELLSQSPGDADKIVAKWVSTIRTMTPQQQTYANQAVDEVILHLNNI